jgi:DNA-binding GntR family transcriptional regulator
MTGRDSGQRFDPRGPRLVYMLIADDIAAKIADGTYAAEQRLPSETDLAAEYGAARMTARRAIRELRDRSLVETVHGKGTYVVAPGRRRKPEPGGPEAT